MRHERNKRLDRERRRRTTLAQLNGQPTSMIPAPPIRNQLRRLAALGWSYEALAAWYGTGTGAALNLIATGHTSKSERKFEGITHLPYTVAVPDHIGDNLWVPTLGARRRIRGLLRLGWKHDDLEEYVGRSTHAFASGTYLRTRAIDWRIVAATYEQLSAATGQSTKTASRAEAMGYAPPFAWNDIDNPNEQPHEPVVTETIEVDPVVVERLLAGDRVPSTVAEKDEAMRRWRAFGKSEASLCNLHGWKQSRYGRNAA